MNVMEHFVINLEGSDENDHESCSEGTDSA
jgi:hypothetical protein